MISNKYGFIYIHTPKTGGTSVSSQLYSDTDQECEIVYEDDGEGIASLYPSSEDFPWWSAWMKYVAMNEGALAQSTAHAFIIHIDGSAAFGTNSPIPGMGSGNIKHLPLARWLALLHDPRFTNYGSFGNQYATFGNCRNPYTREFSWFWYCEGAPLLSRLKDLSDKRIEKAIREEWEKWVLSVKHRKTRNVAGIRTEEETNIGGMPNQSYWLCTPKATFPLPSPDPTMIVPYQRVQHLVRMEHIEEDYNNICNVLSIPRKSSTLPHKLNRRAAIRKHIPDNILEWYTNEMLDVVHTVRAQDFEVLPYEMGRPSMMAPEG